MFPIAFFALLGWHLHENRGHYNNTVVLYFVLFLCLLWQMVRRERAHSPAPTESPDRKIIALAATLVLFTILSAVDGKIEYPETGWAITLFRTINVLLVGLSLGLLRALLKNRPFLNWAYALAGLSLFNGWLAIQASPNPYIDVFVNNTAATDYFLNGLNPYSQFYPDIYAGRYDYKPGFLYFPGTLYWLVPFRLLGDVRLTSLFAQLMAAWGLWEFAKHFKLSERARVLSVLLWICFPVTYFVVEQAWTDPILVALTIWTFLFVERKQLVRAGICMGCLFSVKQYAFLIPFFALIRIHRHWGWRSVLVASSIGALTVAACIGPFLVWDWQSLYFSTVQNQTAPRIRRDALTMMAFIWNQFGWEPSKGVSTGLSVLGMGGATLFSVSRAARGPLAPWIALLMAYGAAFFFGKWAFCNYHYLLASFAAVYILVMQQGQQTNEPQ